MSRQELIQSAMEEMIGLDKLDQTINGIPGYTLERHMGPKLVEYLFNLRDYTTQGEISRTRYHANGIDIHFSSPDAEHAIEFTTNDRKSPESDYDTVLRDDKTVDVYWFITTKEWSDPVYPNCDVTFEGVGSSSLLEALELKTGAGLSNQTSVANLRKFAELTGYNFEQYGTTDLGELSKRSFGCEIAIYPPLVAMWPKNYHTEFMQKLEKTSKSLTKPADGGLRDFLKADETDPDLFYLRIETHLHTINLDTPSTAVNPPPEIPNEIEVNLSDEGVEDSFVPIRLCEGTEEHPQKLHIEPMNWLQS